MKFTIHPVILCGGSGTRLWPLSTPETPKQFLALTSSKSMIEDTAGRFQSTDRSDLDFASLLVVGSKRHEKLLTEKLPNAQMVLEPMGRDSAPAVAAAAMMRKPDDLILILPADHDIRDVPAFHHAIAIAAEAAEDGAIVTFGIQPTHPATGYGYIKAVRSVAAGGAINVEAFVEKPDVETAQRYLDAGDYYWNAGIFLFKAGVMLDALEEYAPGVNAGTRAALGGTQGGTIYLNAEAFAATPSISIDYAVMEQASNVKTVPVSMGWSDVGGYRALHALLSQTETDNVTSGPVHLENSSGLYVRSEGPAIAINGVSNLVVVATDNEVMITPMNDDTAVKSLGKAVQKNGPALGLSPDLRTRAKDWLWTAFETWSKCAWDPERGGFVEQLHMDGTPDRDANRRVRVQARQVFSFAKAIELGWPEADKAKRLVDQGLEYIDTKLRHPDGGWVHVVDPSGTPIDDKRDLYDHAFIILAGATAYKVTESALGLRLAQDALAFVDTHLKDHEFGGWREAIPDTLPRRSNPHMHMLEAMMALYEATGDEGALERASEIVTLFESKFFVPGVDVLAEFFETNWVPCHPNNEIVWEPGHHYEWATLLSQFDAIMAHDTLSWRRRLICHADKRGLNSETGFAVNAIQTKNTVTNSNSRLWHQLERSRAYLLHPELTNTQQTSTVHESIFRMYLNPGPLGGWIDELDARGAVASGFVPASMLYHAITSLALLVK